MSISEEKLTTEKVTLPEKEDVKEDVKEHKKRVDNKGKALKSLKIKLPTIKSRYSIFTSSATSSAPTPKGSPIYRIESARDFLIFGA